jgi:hypothetical protein
VPKVLNVQQLEEVSLEVSKPVVPPPMQPHSDSDKPADVPPVDSVDNSSDV